MFSGNDSGNTVMQKTSWCDSLYRQNISTPEIQCQLMLVFGGGVLRPHLCRKRVKRVKSGLACIHHEDGTFQPGRSRTCEHGASGGTGFEKTSRNNPWFVHCIGVICEKCTQHRPCTAGIQQCVCMLGTKIHD